jgi:hypothetical protein
MRSPMVSIEVYARSSGRVARSTLDAARYSLALEVAARRHHLALEHSKSGVHSGFNPGSTWFVEQQNRRN